MGEPEDDKITGRIHGEQFEPEQEDTMLMRLIYMLIIALMISLAQTVLGVATLDDRVVSASRDGTLRVWDPQTGQRLATFHADARLECVAAGFGFGDLVAGDSVGRLHWLHFEEAAS